jgi:succinate-semialdehyde dehydrogenase/glutarate-semialdehyde dehydrogenase
MFAAKGEHMSIDAVNPADGGLVRSYEEASPRLAEEIVARAHETFRSWKETDFARRAGLMREAARVLKQDADAYARLMAVEMGKPIREGRAEVEKCAWVCEYYADNAERFLEDEHIEAGARASYVTFRPLGVVLAVMPWNFPFWQVFRFAAPALMAGNAGVLKHASNVPGCALAIEQVFRTAGFPEHVFRTLLIGGARVAAIIENPLIAAVTLTGSTPAGRAVAGKAGEMLKRRGSRSGGCDLRHEQADKLGPELYRREAVHRRGTAEKPVRGALRTGHETEEHGRSVERRNGHRPAGTA